MAEAGCLEGKTLWLEAGLHCRGRGSPPGEGRVRVRGSTWLFKKNFMKVVPTCYNKSDSTEVSPSFQPSPYNEPWQQFGGFGPFFLMLTCLMFKDIYAYIRFCFQTLDHTVL